MTRYDIMLKLAEEQGLLGSIRQLGRVDRSDLKMLKHEVGKVAPATQAEEKAYELAGRPWTKGQYVRAGLQALGAGATAHGVGTLIEGGDKELGKTVWSELKKPRKLARSMVMGAIFAAGLPAARRIMDIEAAKRGKF